MGFKEDWVIAAMSAADDDEEVALNMLLNQH